MKTANIVSPEDWLAERKSLLEREKEFTRARDKLSTATYRPVVPSSHRPTRKRDYTL